MVKTREKDDRTALIMLDGLTSDHKYVERIYGPVGTPTFRENETRIRALPCAPQVYVLKTSDNEVRNRLGWTCGRALRFASLRYFVIPVLFLVASCSLGAQIPQSSNPTATGPTTTIKSEVRLVLVDVVVTTGKGDPVGGLPKKDFEIAEDDHPQTISFFEEHTGGRITRIALPPAPPDVYTNYPTIKTTDSINVLLLDSLNTQATDQTYLRPQMIKFLQSALTAPAGARVAIFTLGQRLRIVRGFTADYAALLNSFTDPKSGAEPKFETQLASPSRKGSELLACEGIRAPAGIAACKEFFAEEDSERAADRVSLTLREFQALARYLAQFPGRKNVMWVSGSFPPSFFPETNPRGVFRREYQGEIRQTADLLTADQVAVYPISATGLAVDDTTSAGNYGKPLHDGYSNRAFEQIAMETLAEDTGGKAFYNTNGLGDHAVVDLETIPCSVQKASSSQPLRVGVNLHVRCMSTPTK